MNFLSRDSLTNNAEFSLDSIKVIRQRSEVPIQTLLVLLWQLRRAHEHDEQQRWRSN